MPFFCPWVFHPKLLRNQSSRHIGAAPRPNLPLPLKKKIRISPFSNISLWKSTERESAQPHAAAVGSLKSLKKKNKFPKSCFERPSPEHVPANPMSINQGEPRRCKTGPDGFALQRSSYRPVRASISSSETINHSAGARAEPLSAK